MFFQGVNHMHHQWIEGNLPVASKCAVCDKTCGSVIRYTNFLQIINCKCSGTAVEVFFLRYFILKYV